jgi:transposase
VTLPGKLFQDKGVLMDPSKISQVKHLYEVEHLTRRQIAETLHMCHKTVRRIIEGKERRRRSHPPSPLESFARLIEEWYQRYPSLQATQIKERLASYGYQGSYRNLCRFTEKHRKKRQKAYHELEFLPGEVAQVDWMEASLAFGKVYGFVFILTWSRYLFVRFYPRSSMEFFLDGHVSAYKEINGAARSNWYDNLKSVVITRKPLIFNAQFVDYLSHMGVSIHACNPGKGNEKGRVERAIRDIRAFVETHDFANIDDLNRKTDQWRRQRNERVHRATHTTPVSALSKEPLLSLPAIPYKPYRVIQATIGKTAFVEFDTNRYSVPVDYANMTATILAYADHVEIVIGQRKVAHHARSFGRHQKIENPSHREKLLDRTPHGKYERVNHLMRRMGAEIGHFLTMGESEGEEPILVAYGLFRLLRGSSKEMLLSAVREANALHVYKLRYVESLIWPQGSNEAAVYPQNTSLLDISYEKRELTDYDGLV